MVELNHTLPTDLLNSCEGLLYCFSQWAYDVTGGLFWALVILAFVVVLYMATFRFGTPRAYGFASFGGMMVATWFAVLELLTWWIASVYIIAGMVGFAVMIISRR